MSTGTLFLATIFFVIVGVVLIGGGIVYLVMDSRKNRKK